MYAGHFDFTHPLVWTVDDVLTADECGRIIADLGDAAWLSATVNSASGRVVNDRLRNNTLALIDDPDLADLVMTRLGNDVPQALKGNTVVGIKDRLRCYRYQVGQYFGLHNDQSYSGREGERSELTMMVYLNDDYEGGETAFPELERVISPKVGMALLFQHMVLHEGRAVTDGTKYVLRSDVLYRPAA